MNRNLSVPLLAGTVFLASGVFHAVSTAKDKVAGGDAVGQGSAVSTPVPERKVPVIDRSRLAPMHREIFDAVESERLKVEDLNLRYTRAVLPAEKLAIQKEIEAVKKAGMIAVYEIQLRHARAGGRTEVAAQLEAAIEAVRNPKPFQGPEGKRLVQERP